MAKVTLHRNDGRIIGELEVFSINGGHTGIYKLTMFDEAGKAAVESTGKLENSMDIRLIAAGLIK